MKKPKKTTVVLASSILLIIAFVLGYQHGSKGLGPENVAVVVEEEQVEFWTCSMHPQVQQPGPGQCPICFMDLIPVTGEEDEKLGPREIKLSEHARKMAKVETAVVQRRFVPVEIRMFGRIEYDESRIRKISAWMAGRLERLFVDYTGIPVDKGEHLVEIYSPELITAQEELLQAKRALNELKKSKLTSIVSTAERTVEAVREKLRLLGLTDSQIRNIEEQERPTDRITVYAPISGIVIHKNAVEGSYVDVGSEIYTIADLSRVWLLLDAYESDLVWLKLGQSVEFEAEAYPGESFEGTIAFIDPVLDEKTRTVKVRVNVENEDRKLKPGMFASAIVHSIVAVEGKVMVPELIGKWMCPMHPEIVKDFAGKCDICGMALKKTEDLGYATVAEGDVTPPLVIPDTAPLITGKRAVVYVESPDQEGVYEGREIVLGALAEGFYTVREGLFEGEKVVVQGSFKIDSEAQIRAKTSMMSPEDKEEIEEHIHHSEEEMVDMEMAEPVQAGEEFLAQLDSVYEAYFEVWKALSQDDTGNASEAAERLLVAADEVEMQGLNDETHLKWMKELKVLQSSAKHIIDSEQLEKARASFEELSKSLTRIAKDMGTSGNIKILRYFCPMAFDNKGGYWLQNESGTQNPYFGSMMFKCGEEKEVLAE